MSKIYGKPHCERVDIIISDFKDERMSEWVSESLSYHMNVLLITIFVIN